MATVRERLNIGSPSDIADGLRFVSIGDVLAGLTPVEATEPVTSGTVFEVPTPGTILSVSTAGTALVMVDSTVTPAAGEVSVSYTSNGVATLTFQAAVTEYTYTQMALPDQLANRLNSEAYVEP